MSNRRMDSRFSLCSEALKIREITTTYSSACRMLSKTQ